MLASATAKADKCPSDHKGFDLGLSNLEDDIEFYRHPERKACDSDHQTNRCLLNPKDVSKQVGDSVCDSRLVNRLPRARNEDSKPNHASHPIQRTQMFLRRCEHAQRCSVGGISSGFDIEFFPNATHIFRFVVHNGEHPAEEEQVSRL